MEFQILIIIEKNNKDASSKNQDVTVYTNNKR